MTTLDIRLMRKGRKEPRDGLLQQAKVHIGLAKHYAAELTGAGWTPQDTAALEADVANLEAAAGAQAKAYDHAADTTSGEAGAIDNAKTFIRKLRHALPRALREAGAPGVTLASFNVGETLHRSTPRISTYLATIRPAVAALDPALKKHFQGKKASGLLDAVKDALDKADTAQELARKHAPGETRSLHEMMGRVLEQIEDLNRAGKSAFDGDRATQAKFDKEILLRARKGPAKTKKEAEEAPAAQPAAPA